MNTNTKPIYLKFVDDQKHLIARLNANWYAEKHLYHVERILLENLYLPINRVSWSEHIEIHRVHADSKEI